MRYFNPNDEERMGDDKKEEFQQLIKKLTGAFRELQEIAFDKQRQIVEQCRLIKELKRIIYINDCIHNDDEQGEAGISGTFYYSSDNDTSSSSYSE